MEKPATPLPCPFCGAADPSHQSDYGDESQIVCGVCDARGPMKRSYFGSIDAWNRRVPDLTAINAELVEAGRAAETWLRAISTWLLETDNDMKLPGGTLDTDPLDLADAIAAALARTKDNSNGSD